LLHASTRQRLGNKAMSLFAREVPGFECADWSDTRLFWVSMLSYRFGLRW
jgi:hypothetical protein